MTMRVLIVDDEPLARAQLADYCSAEEGVVVVEQCGDGRSAARALERHQVDLVLLDIQIPEPDGMLLASELRSHGGPVVIFVTAHERYAARAFEVEAVDYLLKPVSRSRFRNALGRARTALTKPGAASARTVGVVTERGVIRVDVAEIERIEAAGNYAVVHTDVGALVTRRTMQELEAELGEPFARIHRGLIVNVEHIREIVRGERGEWRVILRRGSGHPIGRRYRAALQELVGRPRSR